METKKRILFALTFALVSAVASSAEKAAENGAEWRTSFAAFAKAVDEFPRNDLPFCSTGESERGRKVSSDAPVMKRFGGAVEFEGNFEGIFTDTSLTGLPKREQIRMEMPWPKELSANGNYTLALYPKKGTLKTWRALETKSRVKFRAVVAGITRFEPWIPGSHVQGISILLEDAEIVTK